MLNSNRIVLLGARPDLDEIHDQTKKLAPD